MTSIAILYDGGSVLGVEKPAGLSTQAPKGCDSLENRLREQLSSPDLELNYIAFPHRLDRCVSGVVLVALTKRAARLLSEQFASRKTEKTYLAIVAGNYAAAANESHAPDPIQWQDMIRKISDQAKAEICGESDIGAKQAITSVQIVKTLESPDRTVLQLQPVTGRMHQLRIQAAARGFPIVGDTLYALGGSQTPSSICLHAQSISFHDPKNGRKVSVECPTDDFDLTV